MSRLVRIDLQEGMSKEFVSGLSDGKTSAHFLVADRSGNLLVACGGDEGDFLFQLDTQALAVTTAWSLPGRLAMQPIADATGIRVVLQGMNGAPEIIRVNDLGGFTPDNVWDNLAFACLR